MHMYKESLPHIPQHIIEAYVKKPFDKVLVEYEEWTTMYRGMANYKLKLNQDGTLAVSLVEEKMYSKEEVEDFGRFLMKLTNHVIRKETKMKPLDEDSGNILVKDMLDKWIKENL